MANAFAPSENITGVQVDGQPTAPPNIAGSSSGGTDSIFAPDKVTSGLADIQREGSAAKEGLYGNITNLANQDAFRAHHAYDAEAATAHDIPTWNEEAQKQKFSTDPVKAFGSVGSVFAMIAAAFTHRPMINALQGSAAAMDAVKAGDDKAYDQAFTAFKTNADLAIKRHQMMHEEYQDALSLMNTDMAAGEAQLKMAAHKYDDKQMLFLTENGLSDMRDKLITGRAKSVEATVEANDKIDAQSLRRQTFDSMKADVEKSGIPKTDPRYAALMAEAGRRAFAGKETPIDPQMWQWEMQHAQDHDGKGPTAEERQKFYAGFRTSVARETPDMEFLRKYQEEHATDNDGQGVPIEEAYGALSVAKNKAKTEVAAARQAEIDRHNRAVETISAGKGDTSAKLAEEKERHDKTLEDLGQGRLAETVRSNVAKDKIATIRQSEIDRHNQAVETISSSKGDTSAALAKEKERHDNMTEALTYAAQELGYGKLTETIRTNTVKAQEQDARQEEIERHNKALESLTGTRGDISSKLADERERHDKAMEGFTEQRLSAPKLPTNAGEKAQAVEEMLADPANKGMKREEAIAAVDAKIASSVAKAKLGGDALLDDDTVSIMADQYMAGDKSVLQNLGRGAQGAQNIVKVREAVMRKAKEQNLKGADLALRMAEFNGLTAGQRTLGSRVANVEMFANETLNMIDVARKSSADVPRSQWIPVNKALQAFESNTGDPKIRAFGAAINSLVNTYAKAIAGGGQATVSDKDHAREIITSADSQAQFDAVMKVIEQELQAARKAPGQVKEQFRDLAGSNSLDKPLAPEQNVIKYDINGKRIP